MGIAVQIKGRDGRAAEVSPSGEIAVGPVRYSQSKFNAMDGTGAFTFFGPLPGQQFVITGMRLKAAASVSPSTEATVIVYEATASDSTTVARTVHQEPMLKDNAVTLLPLSLLVNEGVWLNGKTDDPTVNITIFGYYISALA